MTYPVTMYNRIRPTGSRFNIKMSSCQYRKSHCGDKTVVRSSYLHNGISYTGKVASLYWFSPLVVWIKKMNNAYCRYWGSNSFVYSSGYCHRWRSRMHMKTLADSLFVLCKLAYFVSATTEQFLIISPRNFVPIKRTPVSISYRNSSWICYTIRKI